MLFSLLSQCLTSEQSLVIYQFKRECSTLVKTVCSMVQKIPEFVFGNNSMLNEHSRVLIKKEFVRAYSHYLANVNTGGTSWYKGQFASNVRYSCAAAVENFFVFVFEMFIFHDCKPLGYIFVIVR